MTRPEQPPPPSRLWLRLHPLHARVPGLARVPRPARRALRRLLLTGRLRRHTARLNGVLVGCNVRRCVFDWLCTDCIYLSSRPPDSCVEAA